MMHRLIVWVLFLFLCSSIAWGQLPVPGILGLSDNSMVRIAAGISP